MGIELRKRLYEAIDEDWGPGDSSGDLGPRLRWNMSHPGVDALLDIASRSGGSGGSIVGSGGIAAGGSEMFGRQTSNWERVGERRRHEQGAAAKEWRSRQLLQDYLGGDDVSKERTSYVRSIMYPSIQVPVSIERIDNNPDHAR